MEVRTSFHALENQGGPSAAVAGHVSFLASHLGGTHVVSAPETVAELPGSQRSVSNANIKKLAEASWSEVAEGW